MTWQSVCYVWVPDTRYLCSTIDRVDEALSGKGNDLPIEILNVDDVLQVLEQLGPIARPQCAILAKHEVAQDRRILAVQVKLRVNDVPATIELTDSASLENSLSGSVVVLSADHCMNHSVGIPDPSCSAIG